MDNSDRLLFKGMQDVFQCRDGKINMDCCVSAGAHTAGIKTKMKKRKEKTRDKCRCKNIVEIRFSSLFFKKIFQFIKGSIILLARRLNDADVTEKHHKNGFLRPVTISTVIVL